jgi:Cu(I)/Ag(I) efflux system protein CusF
VSTEIERRQALRKITLLILALSTVVLPQMSVAQSAMVNGQVTKIDEAAGKITLKQMEGGMTMVFRVQDPAMFKQVKVADKVKFDADRVNGQLTVTKIEKSK